ncbi:MAG: iron-sulfur cluster carrier protein ApbC [Neisseriaceae bacterium]|nr:MAG: iron-sulfur cluster carrier protein ApbC [Neisseriaceae bacterium]
MMDNRQKIERLLREIAIPNCDKRLGDFNFLLKSVDKGTDESNFLITLPFPINTSQKIQLVQNIKDGLSGKYSQLKFDVDFVIKAKKVQSNVARVPNIKNIIAVASGKGGVGKSTVSANLAIELNRMGAKVGLLDADLYGPSQTLMMGVRDQKPEKDKDHFIPVNNHFGIEIMSMGFLIDDDQAVVWRGPMISKALQQLLFFTKWGSLDYLIIDLPPGTGDTQLTLSKKIPVTASVVVTTPQEIALIDAGKAISMFDKVSIPVLGIIENMSYYICSNCYAKEEIFGSGGGEKLAQKTNVALLGQLPLACEIREAMDTGSIDKMGRYSELYQNIAWQLVLAIVKMSDDYSHHFSNISIETR